MKCKVMKVKYEAEVKDCSECNFFGINISRDGILFYLDSIECNWKVHKYGKCKQTWFSDAKEIKDLVISYPCQLRPCPIEVKE